LAIYAIKNIEPEEEIILNYNEGEKINKDVHFWIDLN
jgi:histone-lysine N-methyltransferase EZH2